MTKKVLLLVVLVAVVLVSGCASAKGTETAAPTSTPTPTPTLTPSPTAPSVCTQTTQPVIEPAFKNLGGDKAILFVWDNSGSLEQNGVPLVEFRYRFPLFFARALSVMAKTPGLNKLGDIKISFASVGTLGEEDKLHTVKGFTEEKDMIGEQKVGKKDIVYQEAFKQAFEGGEDKWLSDAGGQRLVVVFTDGDFMMNEEIFNKWDGILRSNNAEVLWVLFPLSSQTMHSNRLYDYSDHETDRQKFIVLDEQNKSYEAWGKMVWGKIFSMLFPSFGSSSIQWINSVLSTENPTVFSLPQSIQEKRGFFVLHVLGWDENGNVLPKVDPHVNGRYVGIIPPKGWSNYPQYMDEIEVDLYKDFGVGWVTYNVLPKEFSVKVVPQRVVNNGEVTFRVTACNAESAKKWPEEVPVYLEETEKTMIGKALRHCEGQSTECAYVLNKPEFEHEGRYLLQIGDFGVGEVEAKFEPTITSVKVKDNEIVVAIKNITQNQLASLNLRIGFKEGEKDFCCAQQFGNLCFGSITSVASIGGRNNRGWQLIPLHTTEDGLPLSINTARVSISGCREDCWEKCKDKILLTLQGNDEIYLPVWPFKER